MSDAHPNPNRRNRLMVAGNLLFLLFQGVYTVSPIDLLPEIFFGPLGYADDAIGLLMAVAFTVYTINTLRHQGVKGLAPGRGRTAIDKKGVIDVEPIEEQEEGYKPLSVEELKQL